MSETLTGLLCQRRNAPVFLQGDVSFQGKFFNHRAAVHHRGAAARKVGYVEARERLAALAARLMRAHAFAGGCVAAHREAEAVLEVEPADLAVGDDAQPGAFLQREVLPDAFELDRREFLDRYPVFVQPAARVLPRLGPQEAADDIGADARRGYSCLTPAVLTAAL